MILQTTYVCVLQIPCVSMSQRRAMKASLKSGRSSGCCCDATLAPVRFRNEFSVTSGVRSGGFFANKIFSILIELSKSRECVSDPSLKRKFSAYEHCDCKAKLDALADMEKCLSARAADDDRTSSEKSCDHLSRNEPSAASGTHCTAIQNNPRGAVQDEQPIFC